MIRGLLWLPLLAVFIGLAWAGWNEYRKLDAYQNWAQQFERAKYDIYSVLGQSGNDLTWGIPTRNGPINLNTFSLKDVESLRLSVDRQFVDPNHPPPKGRQIYLEFQLSSTQKVIQIPFTDLSLAARWTAYLDGLLK
jgi:hypothetical protein